LPNFLFTGGGDDIIFNKQEIGRRGEAVAAEFLERKGLVIAERNYHSRWGELDLVAVDMPETDADSVFWEEGGRDENRQRTGVNVQKTWGTVHFVEVKTRTGTEYGTPGEAVTYSKQQKIRKTALLWLQEQDRYFPCVSFDVIEVWVVGKTAKIRWLPHCF
jgi:putative endonuclease